MNLRTLFLQNLAQTSDAPLCFEIDRAEGVYLYDTTGKKYIDAIGGISVANVGHGNKKVIDALKLQAEKYLHVMVYGEMVQSPQVMYAQKLLEYLPNSLNNIYFTNSGTEAIEGAMKLAKRYNGKNKIIAFNGSYHGSTQGALSMIGDEYFKNAYRPLLPNIFNYDYNSFNVIENIDTNTCCVFVEPVQAESGVTVANKDWLKAIAKKCKETNTLLIFDESQTGFGRTGYLWSMLDYEITPDILVLSKALGGGLPLGAFIANKNIMQCLSHNPILGHLTTFGGHPLSCTTGLAAFEQLINENYIKQIAEKETLLKTLLVHPKFEKVNVKGLWASIFFKDFEINQKVVRACIESGVFTDYFLFASNALRISPPLSITNEELEKICTTIKEVSSSI